MADESLFGDPAGEELERGSVAGESVAETLAGGNADDEDQPDPSITDAYVQGLTHVQVRTCTTCRHCSTEPNPLTKGPYRRSSVWPTWPWAHGKATLPRGYVCRICEFAFTLGGFDAEHGTLSTMAVNAKDTKKFPTLLEEFTNCCNHMVTLVNTGVVRTRLRGRKRDSIRERLNAERRKVVSVVLEEGTRAKQRFKATPLDDWNRKNPNRDAAAEGHLIQMVRLPGRGLVKCVLLRKGGRDWFDVDVEAANLAKMEEIIDDGNAQLREGQQAAKFSQVRDVLTQVSTNTGPVQELKSEEPAQSTTAAGSAASAASGAEAAGHAEEDEDSVSDASEAAEEDPFAGSLLAGLCGDSSSSARARPASTPKGKVGRSAPKRSPVAGKSLAKSPPAAAPSAKVAKVATPPPADDPPPPAKSRGKGSRIPLETDKLLAFEGFNDLTHKFEALMGKMVQPPFMTMPLDHAGNKAFDEACRQLAGEVEECIKEVVAMDTKLGKRTHTPKDALERVRAFRGTMRKASGLLTEVSKRDLNLERVEGMLAEAAQVCPAGVGLSLKYRFHVAKAVNLSRFGLWSQFTQLLRNASDFPELRAADGLAQEMVADEILEQSFLKLVSSIPGKRAEQGGAREDVLPKFKALVAAVQELRGIISEASINDVLRLRNAIDDSTDPGDIIAPAVQQQALTELAAVPSDDSYSGVLKAGMSLKQSSILLGYATEVLEQKQAKCGRREPMFKWTQKLNAMKSEGSVWSASDRDEWDQLTASAMTALNDEAATASDVGLLLGTLRSVNSFMSQFTEKRVESLTQLLNDLVACSKNTSTPAGFTLDRLGNVTQQCNAFLQGFCLDAVQNTARVNPHLQRISQFIDGFLDQHKQIIRHGAELAVLGSAFLNIAQSQVNREQPIADDSVDSLVESFALIDASSPKLPPEWQSFWAAVRDFKEAFSIRSIVQPCVVAKQKALQAMVKSAMEHAVLEDSAAVQKSLGGFEAAYFAMQKMSTWAEDAGKAKSRLSMIEQYMHVAQHSDAFVALRELPKPEGDSANGGQSRSHVLPVGVSRVRAAADCLAKHGAEGPAVLAELGGSKAAPFLEWVRAFLDLVASTVSQVESEVNETLVGVRDSLAGATQGFNAKSSQAQAAKVKEAVEKGMARVHRAVERLAACGVAPAQCPLVAECEALKLAAHRTTVAWGVELLLSSPVLKDPAKGHDVRAKLEVLYKENIHGQADPPVSKETVADIQAVLATKPLTKPEDQSKAKGSAAPASEAAGSKRRRKE